MQSYCASRLLIIITRTYVLNANHYNEATWKARFERQVSSFLLKVRYALHPRLYQNRHEIHDPKVSEAGLGRHWHEKTIDHARIGCPTSYIMTRTSTESDAVAIESIEHCVHVPVNTAFRPVRTGSNAFTQKPVCLNCELNLRSGSGPLSNCELNQRSVYGSFSVQSGSEPNLSCTSAPYLLCVKQQ
jgi:hypothetical protein